MNYKNQKIIQIIQENAYTGTNKFLINGIDLKLALFFIKKERELFKLVAKGDYTITNEGSNVFVVVNEATIKDSSAFQVGYELDTISSQYPTSEPEINLLKDKYNALVTDLQNLWGYVKNQSLVSDTLDMSLIFPVLGEGETWVFKDGEMKATPLIVAETELQKLLDELTKKSQDILDDYVTTLTTNSKIEINNIVSDSKSEISTLTGDSKNDIGILTTNSKTELTNLLNNSKTDINDYTEDKKEELQNFIDENMDSFATDLEVRKEVNYLSGAEYKENNIFGTDLKNITKGKMYYYGNIPYMAKTTVTNSSGFLIPNTINFQDIRNSMLYEQLYTNLLEFDKVIYNPGGGSNFWKFFRYGKRATFFISYTLSGEIWLDFTKIASFPIGFVPNAEFLHSEHNIYIKTNNHTGEERLILANDGVKIFGVAGKQLYEIKGTINYIVQ